jgi:hypothetical protein
MPCGRESRKSRLSVAKVLDLTLVTADRRLMRIKGISVLANR